MSTLVQGCVLVVLFGNFFLNIHSLQEVDRLEKKFDDRVDAAIVYAGREPVAVTNTDEIHTNRFMLDKLYGHVADNARLDVMSMRLMDKLADRVKALESRPHISWGMPMDIPMMPSYPLGIPHMFEGLIVTNGGLEFTPHGMLNTNITWESQL